MKTTAITFGRVSTERVSTARRFSSPCRMKSLRAAAESVTPTYGLGDDRHDYGRGLYLSDDLSLAKEWAVCRPTEQNGWVHADYNVLYNERDRLARDRMDELISGPANKAIRVMSTLVEDQG